MQLTTSTSSPPSRRLSSTGHVPAPRGLLATLRHARERLDDDYPPLAKIDGDMLLCLHTTAVNASDVLPPPMNNKDINCRPDEEVWCAACIEEFKGKIANDTFKVVKLPKNTLICKTKWVIVNNKLNNDGTLERCARLAGSSAATVNDMKLTLM
eukprot:5070199-Pleurochrysis_carterae.AAC.7